MFEFCISLLNEVFTQIKIDKILITIKKDNIYL